MKLGKAHCAKYVARALDGGVVVSEAAWPWLPAVAQCRECASQCGSSRVTQEHMIAVEVALIGIARVWGRT